jgi:transcription elongation factor GreA-like protein
VAKVYVSTKLNLESHTCHLGKAHYSFLAKRVFSGVREVFDKH